jgi:4-hydroxybenzoate polyprenyltransferase
MVTARDFLELVRAPAALSVPGDAVVGAATSGALGRWTPLLAGGSVCLYWAGMALNDWADREVDAKERPERPIPSGRIRPGAALAAAGALTAVGTGLAALAGRRSFAVAVPLAGAIWAYDLKLKQTGWGSAAMAACRGLDVLLGASCGRVSRAVPAALTVAAHTFTVTELSRREVAGADRWLPLTTLAGTAAVAAVASRGGWAVARTLATWYAAAYGTAQLRAVADPRASKVRAAVSAGITALPVLQAALTARTGAVAAGLLIATAKPAADGLVKRISAT